MGLYCQATFAPWCHWHVTCGGIGRYGCQTENDEAVAGDQGLCSPLQSTAAPPFARALAGAAAKPSPTFQTAAAAPPGPGGCAERDGHCASGADCPCDASVGSGQPAVGLLAPRYASIQAGACFASNLGSCQHGVRSAAQDTFGFEPLVSDVDWVHEHVSCRKLPCLPSASATTIRCFAGSGAGDATRRRAVGSAAICAWRAQSQEADQLYAGGLPALRGRTAP